jgi:hypothetical protein
MKSRIVILVATILLFAYTAEAQEQKEINVGSFSKVKFEGSAQWILIPSDEEKVIIESESEDVFDKIFVDLSGDKLTISTVEKNKNISKLFKSVTIKVYLKSIESVALSGVGSVSAESSMSSEEFEATLRGTGNMNLDIQCSEFTGNMFGTGTLTVAGSATTGIVKVEGVGSFEGFGLVTTDMNITVSGVGGAKVYATGDLTATLNGVGSIRYKGEPNTKSINSNGLGSIKQEMD